MSRMSIVTPPLILALLAQGVCPWNDSGQYTQKYVLSVLSAGTVAGVAEVAGAGLGEVDHRG